MSLFARILSHGFGLVVVVMLGLGLIYRGDLFPGMELPEFLAYERAADSAAGGVSGSVTRGETVSADDAQAPGSVDQQETTDETGSVPDTPAKTVDSTTVPPMTAPNDGAPVSPVEGSTLAPATAADDVTASDGGDVKEEAEADAVIQEIPAAAPAADQSAATDSQTRAAPPPPVAAPPPPPPVAAPVAPAGGSDLATPPATTKVIKRDLAGQAGTTAGSASAAAGQADTAADLGSTTIDQPAETARATGKPAESPYRLLAAAREAYWLRDYDTAEQKYRAMIDLDPTNPDGFGELGNMYFSQGKWELASATYFEAGKRLADEGLLEQARQLVDVLKGLQGSQAKALEKYIADKSATTQ